MTLPAGRPREEWRLAPLATARPRTSRRHRAQPDHRRPANACNRSSAPRRRAAPTPPLPKRRDGKLALMLPAPPHQHRGPPLESHRQYGPTRTLAQNGRRAIEWTCIMGATTRSWPLSSILLAAAGGRLLWLRGCISFLCVHHCCRRTCPTWRYQWHNSMGRVSSCGLVMYSR